MTDRARRKPGRPVGGQPVVEREHLLDAAERAIRRDGAGVSIDAIAQEAGVTKPIVYAKVGNRADLADALAQRLADRLIEAARTAMGKRRTGRTRMVALVRSNLEMLAKHRELFLFVSGGASEDMPQRTLYLAERSAVPLARQLAAWRRAEGLDPSVAVAWSYAIVGLLNLVSLWWVTQSDQSADPSAEQLAEQVADLIWSGLAGAASKRPTK
jgi:AcrR family transcriptional regulator